MFCRPRTFVKFLTSSLLELLHFSPRKTKRRRSRSEHHSFIFANTGFPLSPPSRVSFSLSSTSAMDAPDAAAEPAYAHPGVAAFYAFFKVRKTSVVDRWHRSFGDRSMSPHATSPLSFALSFFLLLLLLLSPSPFFFFSFLTAVSSSSLLSFPKK